VDINRRSEVLFREGDVAAAIVASFSIPAIYPPVQSGDRTLVDGALLTPIPIKAVADLGADIVIAVQLTDPVNEDPGGSGRRALFTPPILQTVSQAFEVMQWKITTDGAIRADVAIEPVFDGPISLADFDRADELVAAGRRAAARARPRIAELLPWIDRQEGSGGC
jgi:NTE family protein